MDQQQSMLIAYKYINGDKIVGNWNENKVKTWMRKGTSWRKDIINGV